MQEAHKKPANVHALTEEQNTVASKPLKTPTDLESAGTAEIAAALNGVIADTFALYIKTKNFHWHVSGPHYRDYHLLFDEQASELLQAIDPLAERVRKIGRITIHSVGEIAKAQKSVPDNNETFVLPEVMIRELANDNQACVRAMRQAHELCDKYHDNATASLLETFIDAAEKRVWFLFEIVR